MDIKSIKQIVELMKESELTEFELEDGDLKLRISRDQAGKLAPVVQTLAPAAPASTPAPAGEAPAAPAADDPNVKIITSPMVGTFYRSPSPESSVFVDVGTKIAPETTVCIIEAMKVMNEIQAEVSGTIIEILVENEQTVEFGQPLFKFKPA